MAKRTLTRARRCESIVDSENTGVRRHSAGQLDHGRDRKAASLLRGSSRDHAASGYCSRAQHDANVDRRRQPDPSARRLRHGCRSTFTLQDRIVTMATGNRAAFIQTRTAGNLATIGCVHGGL